MSKLGLDDTRAPDEWSITEANLERKLANKEQLVLLDIRDRAAFTKNHRDGARNIPLDELPLPNGRNSFCRFNNSTHFPRSKFR
jgi:hypothetical protein